MEQFLAVLHELGTTALAEPSAAAFIGGGTALVLVLLMLLGQSGRMRRLRKALEAEQQSREKLQEAVDGGGKKLEALRNEIGQYQGRLAQLESDTPSQASRIEALSGKLNAQQNLNSQLEQRLAQAEALLKDQTAQLNSQLTQYQAQLDRARQANDARIAELGRQMEQLKPRLAAPRESIQPLPLPAVAPEREANNAPAANLAEQPAEEEPPVTPADAGSETAIIPPEVTAQELEPAPEPAKEAPPIPAEEEPSPSGSQSAPLQPEPPAPTHAPETRPPEKETATKALLSFMADDLKKGTSQLKGLFKLSGKK